MPLDDYNISRLERADQLGLQMIKICILLNGGAFVSVLAYVGNSSSEAMIVFALNSIKQSMFGFLISIVFMLTALIVSYIYTAHHPETETSRFLDSRIIWINGILAGLSLFAFVISVALLICGAGAP